MLTTHLTITLLTSLILPVFSLPQVLAPNQALTPRSDLTDTGGSPPPPTKPYPDPPASTTTPPPCQSSSVSDLQTREIWDKFSSLLWDHQDALGAYAYAADNYIQHNPFIPDGRNATLDILVKLLPTVQISDLFRGYDQGKGWAHYRMDGYEPRPVAFADVFRFEGGCIVEHWDVLEELPDNATSEFSLGYESEKS